MSYTIERLGHHGDGIAAGPIFVPLTLPGEIVDGDVDAGRIANAKILTPSPDRVKPPCTHFKSCGGCNLQHVSDEYIADWKANIVRTALTAQGMDAPITKTVTSAPNSRRRASLTGRRTKKGALVGFHARASGTLIEVPNCQLLHPDLMAVIPALQDITISAGTRKGELVFAITRSQVGVDVCVTGGKPLDGPLRILLASKAEKHQITRLTWNEELVAQTRPPEQKFGTATVVPPAGAFLQATEDGEAALLSAVRRAVGPAKKIADIFAGCGTFALSLAHDAEIFAVEDQAEMLEALDAGWRSTQGLKLVKTEVRDLFRRPMMPDELNKFDAVVIDPPRAGGEAQTSELCKSNIKNIAFVSCNPKTFARDAKMLTDAGYKIEWIEVIDQFRWSPHVELVAHFTRLSVVAKPANVISQRK